MAGSLRGRESGRYSEICPGRLTTLSGVLDRWIGKPGDDFGQDFQIGLLAEMDTERDAAVLDGVGIHIDAVVFQKLQQRFQVRRATAVG